MSYHNLIKYNIIHSLLIKFTFLFLIISSIDKVFKSYNYGYIYNREYVLLVFSSEFIKIVHR